MGDVGSGALGYLLAALWAMAAATELRLGWLLALPLSACVLDATLTLLLRIRRGEKWWQAHSAHTYQILARKLGWHVPVTLGYGLWALSGVAAAIAAFWKDLPQMHLTLICVFWHLLGIGCWMYLRKMNLNWSRA